VSVDFLNDLGVPFIKIGSGDATNPIVMEKVASITSCPLVVSTGMTDMEDVKHVYNLVMIYHKQNQSI
jgi:sialic acid synthase